MYPLLANNECVKLLVVAPQVSGMCLAVRSRLMIRVQVCNPKGKCVRADSPTVYTGVCSRKADCRATLSVEMRACLKRRKEACAEGACERTVQCRDGHCYFNRKVSSPLGCAPRSLKWLVTICVYSAVCDRGVDKV